MPISVVFTYDTGTLAGHFSNVRLTGSWTADGRSSDAWLTLPMAPSRPPGGGVAFTAEVRFADEERGKTFSWGVIVDAPGRPGLWGIMSDSGQTDPVRPRRTFVLDPANGGQEYRVTPCRALGANKWYRDGEAKAGIRFSVWAPRAQKVETVIAEDSAGGYIRSDGRGVAKILAMARDDGGVWNTDPWDPALADFAAWQNRLYMFRITREDGSVAYRTDIYSRAQAGTGGKDPEHAEWNGRSDDLDSTKSCSVVIDPELTAGMLDDECRPGGEAVDDEEFWRHEFDPLCPLPVEAGEMVIYEMHVAGLGAGREGPGTLQDAMGMLDYLVDLGINTIELLPMSGFEFAAGWGYGTAHYYAIKYGRDAFKHFVRACHRRGIAVIVDVVYNHYTPESERVQWMYDATRHDRNMYYYYHGKQEDYPDHPDGGYCDNYSTGYLPNMAEERVRAMMIGSAVAMALEFHVDGFRMDLTQALHSFNVLHVDGRAMPEANEAGIRFMREWVRTLRFFKPRLMLLAEDHSNWNMIARSPRVSGLGFDAVWWSEWYHQLIGDASQDDSKARLLRNAGFGTRRPLNMAMFAGMMLGSPGRVVYHESHDEAGNSRNSARNIEIAVNHMLFDNTRFWAEARCRVAAGLSLLSAGTPMFFMGEEVAAREPYRHGDFLEHREDFKALRNGSGAGMFRYYQDLIRLRREVAVLRSPIVEILKVHNKNRILAYRRWWGDGEYVVVASLNDNPFGSGYVITHRNLRGKTWACVLNSDAAIYGGSGFGDVESIGSEDGNFNVRLPACCFLVFARLN